MNDLLIPAALCSIPCCLAIISLGVVIVGFIGAHKLEESFPKLENHISLALWCAIPATLVSLSYVRLVTHGPEYLPLEGAYLFIRGWPVGFYGYTGINLLVLPIYILIDIGFWFLAGFTILLVAGRIKQRSSGTIYRTIYRWTAVLIILSPLTLSPINLFYTTYLQSAYTKYIQEPFKAYQDELAREAYRKEQLEHYTWAKETMVEMEQAISFEGCNDQLVPSETIRGGRDIEIAITAAVKDEHRYGIAADLNDDTYQAYSNNYIDKTLEAGDHPLKFYFPVASPASGLLIHHPGPYKVTIRVVDVIFFNRRLTSSDIGDRLEIICQTKAYQLADLDLRNALP